MISQTQNLSLEDVLGAFAVEPDPGRETLAAYLRRYPQFAEPLIDLSRELHRTPTISGPDTAEDTARIADAWRQHSEAAGSAGAGRPVRRALDQELRDLSKALDVPRQVITAFRDRRMISGFGATALPQRLAAAVNQPLEHLAASLAPSPDPPWRGVTSRMPSRR